MMKNIINICSSFMPADNIGGPSFCGFDLLNQIDKIGNSIILSFDQGINKEIWDIRYNKKEKIFLNSSHYFFYSNLLGYLLFIKKIFSYFNGKKSNIFILHGVYNVPYILTSFILFYFDNDIYIIPHGTLERERIKISKNILVRKLSYIYLRLFHQKTKFVFSNKKEYEDSLLSLDKNLFENNFFIPNILKVESLDYYLSKLPNSISKKNILEITKKNNDNHKIKVEKYSDDNSLNLIYFGRISEEKGIYPFLESLLKIIKNNQIKTIIHIHFIGGGNKKYVKRILELLGNYKRNLKFTFYGWLKRDEAISLIIKIKGVMIFPSISDNFNLSFLESILIGKLAIVSDRIATSNDQWLSKRIFLLEINKLYESLEEILMKIIELKTKNNLFENKTFSLRHPYSDSSIKDQWERIIYSNHY